MIDYLFLFFITSFVIENIASLLTESYIFADYRKYIENLKENSFSTKLKYSSTCHQCTSQQLALIFSFFVTRVDMFPIELNTFFIYLLNALALGRASYLLHVAYDKFIFSQGLNLFHTQIIHQGEKLVDE